MRPLIGVEGNVSVVRNDVIGVVNNVVANDRLWRLGLVVARWSRPAQLLYAGPG